MVQITFKGNPIHTNSELPKLGSKVPDFILVDVNLKDHSLADHAGKRKIIMTVPSLETSVCATCAVTFNNLIKKHPDIEVLIVSADLPFAQKRFIGESGTKNVTFLSMMRSKDFANDYGLLMVDGPLAGLCARTVLVLNQDNKLLYKELVAEIATEPNYEKAMEAALA